MNHLQNALSPYLLQHANQPVHWYPWGPEAFAKAKADHKPIFLSIGYSTCHWCHVMAAESFDDQEVAAYLNAHFVAIKVDQEERPDVDAVYMAACLAMTGSGGWPLTIVMDGEGEPFFAATYLSKEGRYGRPGLLDLLKALIRLWDGEDPSLTDRQAAVRASLQGLSRPSQGQRREAFTERSLQQGLLDLSRTFDAQKGGLWASAEIPDSP